MTKRDERSPAKSATKAAQSPNPRDTKQIRANPTDEGANKKDSFPAKNDKNTKTPETGTEDSNFTAAGMAKFNLIDKFKSAASHQGEVCGGQVLWAHLVSPAKTTWTTLAATT